jgi:DNA (cytosine-5)-methyltransferase 1
MDGIFESTNRVYDVNDISPTMNTCGGGERQPKILEVKALRMVRTEEGKKLRKAYENGEIHHGFNEYREAEPREDGISNTITTVQKDNMVLEQKIVAMRGRNSDNPSDRTAGIPTEQRLEIQKDDICNTLTSVQKDNLVLEKKTIKIRQATKGGFIDCEIGGVADLDYPSSETRRGRVIDGGRICPTLMTENIPSVIEFGNPDFYHFLYLIDGDLYLIRIRKLTPLECWRLMDFSDEDFRKAEEVNSNTQLYRQAGNSIVVNALTAIFGQMIGGKENAYKET